MFREGSVLYSPGIWIWMHSWMQGRKSKEGSKYKPSPNVELNLSIIERQRARCCTPASPSFRPVPQLRNPLFLYLGLTVHGVVLAVGAVCPRLCSPLFGVNSSAALASGACAESGCAARPSSTLHLLGEGKKKRAFLTTSCMRSPCSDPLRCNGARTGGRSLQELPLWSLSSPTDDLTLSAF